MPDHTLPRKVRYQTRGYVLGPKLTFLERIRVLCGARDLVSCTIFSEHRPGQTATQGRFFLTNHEQLRDAVREFEAFEEAGLKAKGVKS